MRKWALALLCIVLCSAQSYAEEVKIGHLETNDDTGINWLYLRCEKADPAATTMYCKVFQTLIMKSKSPEQIAADVAQQATTDPLAEFNKAFGPSCQAILDKEGAINKSLKTGVGLDGKPINKRLVGAGLQTLRNTIEVCKTQTQKSADRFFKDMIANTKRSCKVHSDFSQEEFHYNQQTNSWDTTEGPSGPCGTVIIGTLTQDPKNSFWHYVERTLRTNPKGVLPIPGQSCAMYPEHTMNYDWKTTSTLEGCDFIESMPD